MISAIILGSVKVGVNIYGIFGVFDIETGIPQTDIYTTLAIEIGSNTETQLRAAIVTEVETWATNNSATLASIEFGTMLNIKASAHIGDCTNNLQTDYDLLSGLLGLADGLNSSNTALNDVATKVNLLWDILESNGTLATS